jgi:hypothetical protein
MTTDTAKWFVSDISVLQEAYGTYDNIPVGPWGAIHQLFSIILKVRILVLLPVSTLPYVLKVKNYSLIGE